MRLRVARHTDQLEAVAEFYRDRVGFPELGRFVDHDGYDGVFLAVPGTGTHLELTTGGALGSPLPHPESLLILYLDTQAEIDEIAIRIAQPPVLPANPYWRANAVAFEDPDGFRLLLALRHRPSEQPRIRVETHTGPRAELRELFELAEDSAAQLDSYLESGRVLVAVEGDQIVGHLQLVETETAGGLEIRNIAVLEAHRHLGIGRALIAAAIGLARAESRSVLVVATASANVENLRFYQRLGFRMRTIEPDAFTAAAGYDTWGRVDGIRLRDRVWLDMHLDVGE